MDHGFRFREGTCDDWVFRSVVEDNEYQLPERFEPESVILDIGVHIGSFCHAAAIRGATRIHGFEAHPDNFRCARENLRQHGSAVQVRNQAVWRSDSGPVELRFQASHDAANTGGGNVWSNGDVAIQAIPFDDIVRDVTRQGRDRIRFLKIDCEGSEFPILFTSQMLHLIDEIAGEYHEFGGEFDTNDIPAVAQVDGYARYRIQELTEFLQQAGFDVESKRYETSNCGIFRALRDPASAPAPPDRTLYRRPWLWERLRRLTARRKSIAASHSK